MEEGAMTTRQPQYIGLKALYGGYERRPGWTGVLNASEVEIESRERCEWCWSWMMLPRGWKSRTDWADFTEAAHTGAANLKAV